VRCHENCNSASKSGIVFTAHRTSVRSEHFDAGGEYACSRLQATAGALDGGTGGM
jgi:hypothetical protein